MAKVEYYKDRKEMGIQVDKFESSPDTKPLVARKIGYLQSLKDELKRVTWTSKDELVMFTKIALGATFAFGLGIYGADLLIKGCLTGFKGLIHLVFG
jgi:preprotein translocase subunit SecE